MSRLMEWLKSHQSVPVHWSCYSFGRQSMTVITDTGEWSLVVVQVLCCTAKSSTWTGREGYLAQRWDLVDVAVVLGC